MENPDNDIEKMRQDIYNHWGGDALARYDALINSPEYLQGKSQGRAERVSNPVFLGRNQHSEGLKLKTAEALKIIPEAEQWKTDKLWRQMKKRGYIWDLVDKQWRIGDV